MVLLKVSVLLEIIINLLINFQVINNEALKIIRTFCTVDFIKTIEFRISFIFHGEEKYMINK